MKCDQDLCLNLCYDLKKLLWQDELNPRVRCAFGNVLVAAEMGLKKKSKETVSACHDHDSDKGNMC